MIQELLALGLPIGKYVLASALMVIFYWFLFREKATFNNCRLYLLSIALVAILISQFSIVVYTPPAEIVEIEAVQAAPIIGSNQNINNQSAIYNAPVSITSSKPVGKEAEPNKYLALLTVKNVALGVYITVASVLFMLLLVQLSKILALKRRGKLTVKDGFETVESAEIPTPFSFYKTIFLSPNLTGSKLAMILKHEQWHIKHRHYFDVFIIEILVCLFWFNPVLWWVRRELRNVSEFHADRSVLDEGQELYTYQTVILEEVMENNPYLANGFNNSFTKKRFIMMKNKCHIRFATLRRALILPFFIAVFSLLCFTTGISQVKYKVKNANKTNQQVESYLKDSLAVTLDTVNSMHLNATFTPDTMKMNLPNNNMLSLGSGSLNKQQIDKALNDCSIQTGLAIKELNKLLAKNNFSVKREELNLVFKRLDINGNGSNVGQIPLSDGFLSSITKEDLKGLSNSLSKMKINVDRLKKEESTPAKINGFQEQVMSLFQDKFFEKILSGIMQMSMPSDFKPQNHRVIETRFSNGSTTKVYDDGFTTTSKITTSPELSQAEKERKELDDKIWREARRLKSNEFKISDIPFAYSSDEKLVSIVRSKNETKVTYVIPIFEKEWWIYLSDGLTIVDKKTRDRYIVRRVENGLPMNQILVVPGCTHKMIEITEVFPPLKESVEMIDILTLTNDFPNIIMGNRGKDTEFRDVNISDYSKVTVGKVYR
ncbi:MAG TPA: M56 family metallopeptidase [Paludibacter sp.]|nr:M56 family metallopeptidase [Paludibacter sp.]